MFAKNEKKRVGLLVAIVVVLLLVSSHSGAGTDDDRSGESVASGFGLEPKVVRDPHEWFQDQGRERFHPQPSRLDDRDGPLHGGPVGFPDAPLDALAGPDLQELHLQRDRSMDAVRERSAVPTDETVADRSVALDHSDCLPHAPIRIQGDEGPTGFVLGHDPVTGTPVYRPGSGVSSGTGTEEDPYVIEGWCIELSAAFLNGIELVSTSAHVEIRDNLVWNPQLIIFDQGIALKGVDNVQVTHNELAHLDEGITIQDSTHVSLIDNLVSDTWSVGIVADSSPGLEIAGNTLQADHYGIVVSDSDGALFVDNTVQDAWDALIIEKSSDTRLVGNHFDGGSLAVELDESPGAQVVHNVFAGQDWSALEAYDAPALLLSHNRFEESEGGVYLHHSPGSRILHNELTGSGRYGVVSYHSGGSEFKGNHFVGSRDDLTLSSSPGSVVRDNTFSGSGLFVSGYHLEDFQHDVDDSNQVNGKPILYVEGESGVVVPGNVGQAFIVDSSGVVVEGFSTRDTAVGVSSAFNDGFVLRDSHLTGNQRGAHIVASTSVVVEDNEVDSEYTDLTVIDTHGARLAGNTLGGRTGISLYRTEDTKVHANEISGDGYFGIGLGATLGSDLQGNTVSGRPTAVGIYRSTDMTMRDNVLEDGGLVTYGGGLQGYQHDIDISNTVNGKPLRYLHGVSGETLPSDTGQVVIVDSRDITVSGLTLDQAGVPVVVAYSEDVMVSQLSASGNVNGVAVDSSNGVSLENSVFVENSVAGVTLLESLDTRVEGNTLTGNFFGVALYASSDNQVLANTIDGNVVGIEMWDAHANEIRVNKISENSWSGLSIWDSEGNTIAHNNLDDNRDGAILYSSMNNEFLANTVENNSWRGLFVLSSPGTMLRGNNIAGNGVHGLYGWGNEPVDAVDNWWGHATGPEDSWWNPTGQGDEVRGDVEYHMWLLEPNPEAGPGS